MQRNSFLRLFIAAGGLLSAPFEGFAKRRAADRIAKGFKVDSGKARFEKQIALLEGDTFYTKISSKDTEGDLYVFESTRVKRVAPHCITITTRMNGGMYWKANF